VKPRSIRTVLLAGTTVVLLAVLGAAAWLGFQAGEEEASELFDARLATSARVLAALATAEAPAAAGEVPIVVFLPAHIEPETHDEPSPFGHYYETKIAFQVLDARGRVIMRSASAPPHKPYAPLVPGFSTQGEWRVFSLQSGERWIQAAERDDVRAEMSLKIALAAVTPLMVGTPVLLLVLVLLMRYGLRPLAELAARIQRREPGTLAPIELPRSTREIAPVVEALNGLLERERRFTADAAHELRTPLAALKIHAQNAARATSKEERIASLQRVLDSVERSTRLAEQMLAYSRATANRAPAAARPVSLRQVVEDALEDVLPRLKERRQKLAVTSDPPMDEVTVRGDADKLVGLARNLLDNAVRYAPEGSALQVSLRRGPEGATLSVADQGPGIAPALRERVFESYYRIPGSPGEGSGLGLAIVREIAAQHGARVEISNGDGGRGTRITVAFPA
jgi:two-component system sensor histidine kinase QseC